MGGGGRRSPGPAPRAAAPAPRRSTSPPWVRNSSKYTPPEAIAHHVAEPPALDGTLAGFAEDDPLHLDHEDQYRRIEAALSRPGGVRGARLARLGRDGPLRRGRRHQGGSDLPGGGAPPLQLDNEPDLIHSDGLQLYLQLDGQPPLGWLVVPDPGEHRPAGARCRGHRRRPASRCAAPGGARMTGLRGHARHLLSGLAAGANAAAPRFDLSSTRCDAGPRASAGPAGLDRRRRLGLPAGRPAGPGALRAGCMLSMRIPGFTSTGQQAARGAVRARAPRAAFRCGWPARRAARSGIREGARYLDFVMALGAVALGYGHPAVQRGGARRHRCRGGGAAAAGAGGAGGRAARGAAALDGAHPLSQDRRGGGGGGGAAGADPYRAGAGAALRLPWLARLVPAARNTRRASAVSGLERRAAVQ